jgi:hypothetical protein
MAKTNPNVFLHGLIQELGDIPVKDLPNLKAAVEFMLRDIDDRQD